MPDQPVSVIFHKGREPVDVLVDVFQRTRAIRASRWRMGAAVFLPRNRVDYTGDACQSLAGTADYVIADPETSRLALSANSRGRGRMDHSYLRGSQPVRDVPAFVASVLDAQAQVGASVLVSPWNVHDAGTASAELDRTLEYARIAIANSRGRSQKFAVGIQVSCSVLGRAPSRDALLNRLVELPRTPIYLRLHFPAANGRSQYRDTAVIQGIATAVDVLSKNRRPVILPQTGLLGWLMTAKGATSFGVGIDGSMSRILALQEGSGGGGARPLNWYFLPQLLGFVLAEELRDLRQAPGFEECQCPFCAVTPPRPGLAFNAREAGKHYLWWCAKLASECRASGGATSVARRLSDAQAFWTRVRTAGVVLDPRSEAQHLAAWTQAMQA